jgi:threonine dehydratase
MRIVYDVHMLCLDHIEEAAEVIEPALRNTPQVVDAALSRRVGRDLAVKLETFNPVRSFKGRGADYFLCGVASGQRVVCASAGNFGQAIAYFARDRGIAVTVFAARNANPMKVDGMRALGAEVVQVGDDFDAAKDAARAHAAGDRTGCWSWTGRSRGSPRVPARSRSSWHRCGPARFSFRSATAR